MSPTKPDNAALNDLLKELHPEHAEPLWTVLSKVSHAVPQPKAIPNLWKYKKLRPLLDEAGRIVPQEESERRVFMLINPALKRPQTTGTLYAALQYINSGEVAPAHRHPFCLEIYH
ncbi:unnamed protein product [Debaryomyces fabryi]|nr:unnamed protein product [Debaryomyces fabryi]